MRNSNLGSQDVITVEADNYTDMLDEIDMVIADSNSPRRLMASCYPILKAGKYKGVLYFTNHYTDSRKHAPKNHLNYGKEGGYL